MTRPLDEHAIRSASAGEIQEWALVLASAGIPHYVEPTPPTWRLVVGAADADRAVAALEAYDGERRRPETERGVEEYGWTWAGVGSAALLFAFYLVTGPAVPDTVWSHVGSGSAEDILAGEVWRTVTALTLHADAAHLLGNVAAWAVFVTAVLRLLGPGLGGALVLLGGVAGNALNAVVRSEHHTSVGASTAIFAAIGILGGLAFGRRRGQRRAWLGLGAALALLAMLGTSERADLLAHLFGLLAGLVLGVGAGVAVSRPPGAVVQWTLATGALAVVVVSWALAFGAL